MQYLILLLPLLIGMGVIIQSGANTQLREIVGNPFMAALISFASGTVVLILINLFTGFQSQGLSLQNIQRSSWWMWTGGMLGVFFICSVIFMAPKVGPTKLFGLIIASQLIFSVVVDHFGLLGFTEQPINIKKLLGVLMLIGGSFLIQWGKTS